MQDDTNKIIEAAISDKHQFYQLESLPFNFSYYGHNIDMVAITTAGEASVNQCM